MSPKQHRNNKLLWVIRVTCLAAILFGISWILVQGPSVDRLITHTSDNPVITALLLILLYWLTSAFLVFPLVVLYIVAGIVFSPLAALLVNTIGIAGNVTLPFLLSRYTGQYHIAKLIQKYPKINAIFEKTSSNQWLLAFILRSVNLLPVSGVSIFMGMTDISYRSYLSATLCGMFPSMAALTLMGDAVQDPSSPQFFISIGLTIIVTLLSLWIYRIITKKKQHPTHKR